MGRLSCLTAARTLFYPWQGVTVMGEILKNILIPTRTLWVQV